MSFADCVRRVGAPVLAIAFLLTARAVSAQNLTVIPDRINFGPIVAGAVTRTFTIRVDRPGASPAPLNSGRRFALTIRATPPVTVMPQSIQLGEGDSQSFTVTAVQGPIGPWVSAIVIAIGNNEMARLSVRGEFIAPAGHGSVVTGRGGGGIVIGPGGRGLFDGRDGSPGDGDLGEPPRPPSPPSTSAQPPPPAPPPPEPGTSPGPKTEIRPVYWNVWKEGDSIGPSFDPVSYLKPSIESLLVVDVASLIYQDANVSHAAFSPELVNRVAKWVFETNAPTLRLKTVLLLSDAFESTESFTKDLEIDLDKLRNGVVASEKGLFATLRMNSQPDFLLGRVVFKIKPREHELGMTSVGLSIWDANRPVDEISVPICIATAATAESLCDKAPTVTTTLNGVDSLRIAQEGGAAPNASLHFVDLDGQTVRGVFHRNNCTACPFTTWTLKDHGFTELRTHLEQTTLAAFQEGATDAQRLRVGTGLYHVLFPSGTDERENAQHAFEAFVSDAAPARAGFSTVPSIFVRMIGPEADTVFVPFGITAVQIGAGAIDFVGNRFRIEMPLSVQNYQPDPRPLTRWFLVLPPENRTDELGTARKQADPAIKKWQDEAQQTFSDMTSTWKWIGNEENEQPGSALVVLSHHDSDQLYFDQGDRLSADNIARKFARPAVAILDGCGTGAAAGRLIQTLNELGVGAVIATATPVSPKMAGDFLTCTADTLDRNQNTPGFTLAEAYSGAVACLRDDKKYGARAMTWLLLGNGGLQLRAPRKQP